MLREKDATADAAAAPAAAAAAAAAQYAGIKPSPVCRAPKSLTILGVIVPTRACFGEYI